MLSALGIVFSIRGIISMFLGLCMGIVFGAIPGLTSTLALSLLVPVTFGMNPAYAMLVMCGSYCGAEYGGSISAILINTPGTAAAAATAIDGFEMTKKGRAHEALTEAAIASFWGGIASTVALLFFAPVLAKWAFDFGAQEKFLMAIFC